MAYYELNEERNGVEIYFDSIPSDEIRAELREGGWRWFKAKKCWYTRQSDEAIAFAKRVCGDTSATSAPKMKQTSNPASNMGYIMPEMNKRYCYADTVTNFLETQESEWVYEMRSGFSEAYMLALGEVQVGVWKDGYRVLKRVLPKFNQEHPNFHIVFEYSLPYESGRRPDVLLISNEYVIILEFKKKNVILLADIDQTVAYARDIEEYHYETRGRSVSAVLVATEMTGEYYNDKGISICSADRLYEALDESVIGNATLCDINQ